MNSFFKRLFVASALLFVSFLSTEQAMAADPKLTIKDSAYTAAFVSQSLPDPIAMTAGETKTVTIRFKNAGTASWVSTGARYISAYTMGPRDRTSLFRAKSWKSGKQTNAIAVASKPGATSELRLDLTAPTTPGTYTEEFHLASEGYSWVKGGYFFVKIVVSPKPKEETKPVVTLSTTKPTSTVPALPTSRTYIANRFMQNITQVSAVGGDEIRLVLGFQNMGSSTWEGYTVVAGAPTALASADSVSFANTNWVSGGIVRKNEAILKTEDTTREDIYFRAPPKKGTYTANFYLEVAGQAIPETLSSVQVTVTSDAPSHYVAPYTPQNTPLDTPAIVVPKKLSSEPFIRVGIWKPENGIQFRSSDDDYAVFDGTELKGTLPRDQLGVLSYVDGLYVFSGAGLEFDTRQYIRLVPASNPHAVFTLINFTNKVSWKGPNNFNRYRGNLEYRLTQDGETLYAINELLLEDYVKGIAENANLSPMEYLKAQSVAQRTYAYYVAESSDKHDKRNFDVVAHTGDQLYLGQESERIMPRFVEAAVATRGFMVLYDNQVVITPYFANTDGRTRAWTEVWGGTMKPWLVSVKANYDKERKTKLFGHGVGMSQIDASIRAEKEGLDWVSLVKYYYTGVTVEQMFD